MKARNIAIVAIVLMALAITILATTREYEWPKEVYRSSVTVNTPHDDTTWIMACSTVAYTAVDSGVYYMVVEGTVELPSRGALYVAVDSLAGKVDTAIFGSVCVAEAPKTVAGQHIIVPFRYQSTLTAVDSGVAIPSRVICVSTRSRGESYTITGLRARPIVSWLKDN